MSFLTATNAELIYNMEGTGADLALTVTATVTTPSGTSSVPPAYLPPVFSIWQPSSIVGKGFRVNLAGTYDTASALNMTYKYGLDTTQGTFTPNVSVGATGAFPLPNTTAGSWYLSFDIVFTGMAATQGSLQGYVNGVLCAGAGNNAAAAAGSVGMFGGTSSTGNGVGAFSFSNWAGATAYYWELQNTWSSATGSTHFCVQEHQIFGLN